MYNLLIEKLRAYLIHNNPELIVRHEEEFSLRAYLEQKVKEVEPLLKKLILEGKPANVIEELCLEEMTSELRPSKFHYIRRILKKSFKEEFFSMKESGTLTYQTIQLVGLCDKHFNATNFTGATQNDPKLKEQVLKTIEEHLKKS